MFTPASRLFVAAAVFGLLAGIAHGAGSDIELYGLSVLGGLLVVGVFLAVVAIIHRDADVASEPTADASAIAAELAPGPMPTQPSLWPLLAAVGSGILAVGITAGSGYFLAGAVVLLIAGAEWSVQAWSEGLTADPARNREIRNRLMLPFEIPVGVALAGAAGAVMFSRLLLAVSEAGAVVAAGVASTVLLLVGTLVALQPRMPRVGIAALAVVGGLAVLGSGIGGIVAGEREFHHIDEAAHHGEEEPPAGAGLLPEQCEGGLPAVEGECPADRSDEEAEADPDVPAEGDQEGASAIELAADEFQIAPPSVGADAGPVEITYENVGAVLHTLRFEDVEAEEFFIEVRPGASATETVLLETGEYVFFCDVPGHRELGMVGVLTVN